MTLEETAKIFWWFHYAETKGLAKQFSTVVAAVLAFSLTFAEKVIDFQKARKLEKAFLIFSWLSFIVAILVGGASIVVEYNAGLLAVFEPKSIALNRRLPDFMVLGMLSNWLLLIGGVAFVLGLLLLSLAAFAKLVGGTPAEFTPTSEEERPVKSLFRRLR
jgi:hypothetical protein